MVVVMVMMIPDITSDSTIVVLELPSVIHPMNRHGYCISNKQTEEGTLLSVRY